MTERLSPDNREQVAARAGRLCEYCRGSRVGFTRNGLRADFHRPHPGNEAKPYQVRAARQFLELLGITP